MIEGMCKEACWRVSIHNRYGCLGNFQGFFFGGCLGVRRRGRSEQGWGAIESTIISPLESGEVEILGELRNV